MKTTRNVPLPRTLRPFVKLLKVGDVIGHANLALAPLWGEGRGRLDYLLAAEAINQGTLTITEIDAAGSVPELLAVNTSEKMVLLIDGEELVGAKQNRIMNTSVLLRAKSKTKIPVSCVEQGRWRLTSQKFTSGIHAPTRLRAKKTRAVSDNLRRRHRAESDQSAVWQEVNFCLEGARAFSPTMAMRDVVEHRQKTFDSYIQALPYPQGARGIIAAINGKFVAADIFDKPETLKSVWSRLLTGYTMDAICRQEEKTGSFSAKAASVLLEHVGEIECDLCPSVGVGKDWRFEADDIIGQALVANRTCVHMCIFPNEEKNGFESGFIPRILPPSRRRRQ